MEYRFDPGRYAPFTHKIDIDFLKTKYIWNRHIL